MLEKISYIKKIGPNKFRVFSESGKNMGTYYSRSAAKKRLSQIEYFKRKSSRSNDLFLKKVALLNSTATALEQFGFKKEAAKVSGHAKNLIFQSLIIFSGLAGLIHLINKEIESLPLEEVVSNTGVDNSLLDIKKFKTGSSFEEILKDIYGHTLSAKQKECAISIILNENKELKFKDGKVYPPYEELEQFVFIKVPSMERVKSKLEEVIFADNEVKFAAKDILPSESVKKTIQGFEGFRKIPYNSRSIPVWPHGISVTKQGWTVGYGHLLTKEELENKKITLLDGTEIHYWNGISENDAQKLYEDDMMRHSIFLAGVSKDEPISKGLYDALSDMSFNMGVGNLSKFIKSIREKDGSLSSRLFSRNISNWSHSKDESNRKGLLIRAICRILIANGIDIPKNPKDPNSEEEYPSKDLVTQYLIFTFGDKFSVSDEERLLEKISSTSIKKSKDFLDILSSLR